MTFREVRHILHLHGTGRTVAGTHLAIVHGAEGTRSGLCGQEAPGSRLTPQAKTRTVHPDNRRVKRAFRHPWRRDTGQVRCDSGAVPQL